MEENVEVWASQQTHFAYRDLHQAASQYNNTEALHIISWII
jgi:hypothetical protein